MDEVAPGLFVGTLEDASNGDLLREHGISTVVSLTYDTPGPGSRADVALVSLPMRDGPQNDLESFRDAVDETVSRLEAGERVLLHCSAGASRSPSVAATAIALYEDIGLQAAFEQVRERRADTDPHEALVRRAARVCTER